MGFIKFSRDGISGEITFENDVFDDISAFSVSGSWDNATLVDEINSLVEVVPAHTGLAYCSADKASPEDVYAALRMMGCELEMPVEWEDRRAEIAQENALAAQFGTCF